MNTKIVYVLVSSEDDIYLEQAYVSMASVKHHMPDAHICLLTDKLSEKSFVGPRKNEVGLADEIISVDLDPLLKAQKRSRLLKTNFRNYIEGDLLFIDCDTVITRPLYDIENVGGDICACRDSHSSFEDNPCRQLCIDHGHILGWAIDEEMEYYNSGVMLVKDNDLTKEFFKKWNMEYLKGYDKGVSMDQPSLAKTNFEYDHIICPLPDEWNCEFKFGVRYLRDAYIVHYLCTNVRPNDRMPFLLNEKYIFDNIKVNGIIPRDVSDLFDNVFAGIPELTLLLSGSDVKACLNPICQAVMNGSKRNTLLYRFLVNVLKLKNLFIRL